MNDSIRMIRFYFILNDEFFSILTLRIGGMGGLYILKWEKSNVFFNLRKIGYRNK